ncbi:MAG: nucleotidyltransferase domain-containing protein [Armatimonadota bacterium]|nr:nucleotidyltransferase domain-containing protein [Armatimonadota bacterium]MDR5703134.1 nucleotidyltransferase domain-containing protein [Armatimonadota bacterium]
MDTMKTHGIGYEQYREYLEAFTDALVERLGDSLLAVVLYGSVARGTATETSDIDLLIIQRGAPSSYYERLEPILKLEQALKETPLFRALAQRGLSPSVSPLMLSETEAEENRFIFLDMVDDSIVLFDREGFFSRRMEKLRQRLEELGARRIFLPDGSWYWDLKPNLVLGEVFEL